MACQSGAQDRNSASCVRDHRGGPLCRVVGGPEVMRSQIRHVIDTAQLPNVTVQVLPFSVGYHPAMIGSFAALRFPETPTMNTVYVQIQGGALYVEKRD